MFGRLGENDYLCIEPKKKDMEVMAIRDNYGIVVTKKETKVNGFLVKEQVIGVFEDEFIYVSTLGVLFNRFHNGKKSLKWFLNNEFAWVKPNARITRFEYDPFTGEKIDWELIKVIYTH